MNSVRRVRACAAMLALATLACHPAASAQDGPPGITTPIVLPPYNPDAPACKTPPGLQKALAFAQDNAREFMQGVSRGLSAAARATLSISS